MHGPLPEATRSTTVPIKFVPPVSDLPLSVEAQTIATRASTSVVFESISCCQITMLPQNIVKVHAFPPSGAGHMLTSGVLTLHLYQVMTPYLVIVMCCASKY